MAMKTEAKPAAAQADDQVLKAESFPTRGKLHALVTAASLLLASASPAFGRQDVGANAPSPNPPRSGPVPLTPEQIGKLPLDAQLNVAKMNFQQSLQPQFRGGVPTSDEVTKAATTASDALQRVCEVMSYGPNGKGDFMKYLSLTGKGVQEKFHNTNVPKARAQTISFIHDNAILEVRAPSSFSPAAQAGFERTMVPVKGPIAAGMLKTKMDPLFDPNVTGEEWQKKVTEASDFCQSILMKIKDPQARAEMAGYFTPLGNRALSILQKADATGQQANQMDPYKVARAPLFQALFFGPIDALVAPPPQGNQQQSQQQPKK